MSEPLTWIFGYGSLIWRTGFRFAHSRPAFIHGWARRFWQGSTDHRGVPGAPGRVVTLIEAPDEICWGQAYALEPASRDDVLAHLDHREKGGYERLQLRLHFGAANSVQGLMYHATAENENFLGDADMDTIATQVINAHGPSGANVDYVLELDAALKRLGAADQHVQDLANAIRRLHSGAD